MLADLYANEFYSTDITKLELCDKYNITMDDLAHIDDPLEDAYTEDIEVLPSTYQSEPETNKTIVLPTPQTDSNLPVKIVDETQPDLAKFITDIHSFKTAALKEARSQISDAYELDSRELKNLVGVVDILEKSVKGDGSGGNTVNIMVQNIMNKYADDC